MRANSKLCASVYVHKKRTAAPGVLFWFTRLSTPLSDIFIPQLNVVIVNFTSLQMEIGMTSEIA